MSRSRRTASEWAAKPLQARRWARIGEILAGPDTLATVLALQADALARDREKLSQALVLVQKAQAKLAGGQALSIDDLANLSRETVMPRPSVKELAKMLDELGKVDKADTV